MTKMEIEELMDRMTTSEDEGLVDRMTTSEDEELMDRMTTSEDEELMDNVTTSECEEFLDKKSMLSRKLKEMMLKTSQFHLGIFQVGTVLSRNKELIDELMENELEECGGDMTESEAEEYLEYLISILDFIERLQMMKLGWEAVVAIQEFLDAAELAYGEKE